MKWEENKDLMDKISENSSFEVPHRLNLKWISSRGMPGSNRREKVTMYRCGN